MLIAIAFAWLGAWLVIPFAGIELLALGVAFLVHARHAGDYERIVVRADRLIVERVSGGNLAQMECQGPWIRVEYGGHIETRRNGSPSGLFSSSSFENFLRVVRSNCRPFQ